MSLCLSHIRKQLIIPRAVKKDNLESSKLIHTFVFFIYQYILAFNVITIKSVGHTIIFFSNTVKQDFSEI